MGSLDFRADQRQTQSLSPRLQHAVRLLQMSSMDFAAMLRDTLGKNPFLESEDEPPGEPTSAGDDDGGRDDGDPPLVDGMGDDRALWQGEAGAGVRRAEDGELSALDAMSVDTTLPMHLHLQLNVLALPPRDRILAHAIVDSLDDDGYLRMPLEDLVPVVALDPPAELAELQIALCRVQALDPAGVGARSVGECLRLQLPVIDCPDLRALARAIVEEHLSLLAERDTAGLARRLGVSPQRAEAVCDRIRHLDPRPGWRFGSSHVAYAIPDVIVKKVRGEWTVTLNPAVVPKLKLNQVYAELFQRHRTAANRELAGHLQEARWTLRNVEQRFSTILDVANSIVARQRHFLEFGSMAMKPLGLSEIATECGVHESTVSRVTNNKYMATPVGVFELKYFFSRAMVSANGSACSGTAIRGLVQEMIAAETPDAPLSDAEITRQLARQGLIVARRTVTKYRQLLRIESVDRRRRIAA